MDAGRTSLDAAGRLPTRPAVPPRRVPRLGVRRAPGRGDGDRRRVDPERQRTGAVDHDRGFGRRRGRTDPERARAVAQRQLDRRPDGCCRPRSRRRLRDPRRRGSLPSARAAHGRVRSDDGTAGDERTEAAGAARRRRARVAQPIAGDPRLPRRHARRSLPRRRGPPAAAARGDRSDVQAPRGSAHAVDGGGGRAEARAGDGRSASGRGGGGGGLSLDGG